MNTGIIFGYLVGHEYINKAESVTALGNAYISSIQLYRDMKEDRSSPFTELDYLAKADVNEHDYRTIMEHLQNLYLYHLERLTDDSY